MSTFGAEMTGSLQRLQDGPAVSQARKRLLESLNRFTSDRGCLINAGLKMIRDRPLTGVGLNTLRPAYPLYAQRTPHSHRDKPTHAHNIDQEVTTDTGLIGLDGLLLAILCSPHLLDPMGLNPAAVEVDSEA